MTSIFFQAVGKPIHAVISSLTRDIICFVPLVIILPRFFGIKGILYAAPIADLIASLVMIAMTVQFMQPLSSGNPPPCQRLPPPRSSRPHKGVIITIAREHGSAGKQIGKVVAEKLNIPFYYKEVAALAAQESGLHREFISDLNANAPQILHDLYLSTDVVQQAVQAQDQIIRKIADQGSCVIVGRAADYVLRDYDDVVRIFIYAPETYRVQKVMEVYGDTREEAVKNIRCSDEARAAYYHSISDANWGEAHNYDLLLDSSIGVEASAEAICGFIRCTHENQVKMKYAG